LTTLLLDTHAWVWSLTASANLTKRASDSILGADTILVSPISFYEVGQKVRIGKWPEMATIVDRLLALSEEQGVAIAGLDSATCLAASTLPWTNRDSFDRMLAATALRRDVPIVSADTVFDGVVARVW
jgi:PIN domain nuclease of toxin-antitoxin system